MNSFLISNRRNSISHLNDNSPLRTRIYPRTQIISKNLMWFNIMIDSESETFHHTTLGLKSWKPFCVDVPTFAWDTFTLSNLMLTLSWYSNSSNLSSWIPAMWSSVFLCLFSLSVQLIALLQISVSVRYVQTILNDVAQASPRPVTPLTLQKNWSLSTA
jgi:hypothetical protein